MVFAWYMALLEPRNGGTKTLCKRLSPGKQEIMIFIDNVPPPGRTFLTRIYMATASLTVTNNSTIQYVYCRISCQSVMFHGFIVNFVRPKIKNIAV